MRTLYPLPTRSLSLLVEEGGLASSFVLTDQVILVTGATDGVDRETALGLANAGATVLVHGRDRIKGRAVAKEIQQETDGKAELYLADIATQSRVRAVATAITDRHDRIDTLVNNAGASFGERRETDDGIEKTLAVNHLAPFLITLRLLPQLRAAPHARVVTVSSEAHRRSDPQDLLSNLESTNYDPFEAYSRSKLANLLFAYELARRLDPAEVTSICCHPGFVPETRLSREAGRLFRMFTGVVGAIPDPVIAALPGPVRTVEQGARPATYLVSSPDVKYVSGWYFDNADEPRLSEPKSYDPAAARQLWKRSADLVNLRRGERLAR